MWQERLIVEGQNCYYLTVVETGDMRVEMWTMDIGFGIRDPLFISVDKGKEFKMGFFNGYDFFDKDGIVGRPNLEDRNRTWPLEIAYGLTGDEELGVRVLNRGERVLSSWIAK